MWTKISFLTIALLLVGLTVNIWGQDKDKEKDKKKKLTISEYKGKMLQELRVLQFGPGSKEEIEEYLRLQKEAEEKRKKLGFPMREYSEELVKKISKEKEHVDAFCVTVWEQYKKDIQVALRTLDNLDKNKDEDKYTALQLIEMLGLLRTTSAVERIVSFLEVTPPNYSEELIEYLGPSAHPSVKALRRIGQASIKPLRKVVLTEDSKSRRVRLALHILIQIQNAEEVNKWVDSTKLDIEPCKSIKSIVKEIQKKYKYHEEKPSLKEKENKDNPPQSQ